MNPLVDDIATLLLLIDECAVEDRTDTEIAAVDRLCVYVERRRGGMARGTDPDTSKAAAIGARKGASALQERILEYLQRVRRTDDELVTTFIGEIPGSIIKRRGELVNLGLVRDSGYRRPTRTGYQAIVWEAV